MAEKEVEKLATSAEASEPAQPKKKPKIKNFGAEDTSHITTAQVTNIMDRAMMIEPDNSKKAALAAMLGMVSLIFSDERHAYNVTCYLPDDEKEYVKVRVTDGWASFHYTKVLPIMVSTAVDVIVFKQPTDETHKKYERLIKELVEDADTYAENPVVKALLVAPPEY